MPDCGETLTVQRSIGRHAHPLTFTPVRPRVFPTTISLRLRHALWWLWGQLSRGAGIGVWKPLVKSLQQK